MSDIDDYLAAVEPYQRLQLQRIREIVQRTVPQAEEAMSYGMPAFKYKKRPLIGFTANQFHMSVHPFSPAVIEANNATLSDFELSKGTIRFTEKYPIPEAALALIINTRLKEIDTATSKA